ncbi:MAG: hypothetical protein HZC26_04345 [Candidatus Magasanikbacteria bacterium]|nr:hypothetical protein [Candidatus Magasanikbacteria bacterium]
MDFADFYASMSFGAKVGLLGLLIFTALFGLWVRAVVSIVRNKQIVAVSQKIGWIVLNLFTLSVGSIIYFFRFRFLKRAWATSGLMAAFVILIVFYAAVTSIVMPAVNDITVGSGPPIIPGQDTGLTADNEVVETIDASYVNYVKFANPKYHFQLDYPEDTVVGLSEYSATKERAARFPLVVGGVALDQIGGSLTVAEKDISDSGVSPSQYMKEVEDSATQYLSEGEKILELKDIEISGVPAKVIVERVEMPTRFIKVYDVFAVKDGMFFGFTFSADEADYDRFIDVVKYMADSLRIE